jgi:hypothetical protein
VAQALAALGLHATLLLVEPSQDAKAFGKSPADPDAYVSSDDLFAGKSFLAYAEAIDSCADNAFDVIMIDGRARPSCFKHAWPKVKPRGLLILDNSERAEYVHIHKTMDALGWRRRDFAGPGPYNRHFWQTTAWVRPGP